MFIVEQQPHQLGHRDRWMGVVELHGPVIGKFLNRDPTGIQAADHVLQGAAHKEVLLLEPQAAALVGAVIGIEHLGEGFGAHLLLHGAVVIANIECIKIKAFGGVSPP